MATVTAHTAIDTITTYLDIPMGGNSGGAVGSPEVDGAGLADNTAWQSAGGAAFVAGTSGYPGTLDAFGATNTAGTNVPVSGLRMISVRCRATATTAKFAVNAYNGDFSRIYALMNYTNETDSDESLAAQVTAVAHETGELTFTVGHANDFVYLTLIVG
tara:strand:+ start:2243 stop:2719 length:477 start_codon:yes stop_codon:yes gene_type:complete